jgi:hypothetical protein
VPPDCGLGTTVEGVSQNGKFKDFLAR